MTTTARYDDHDALRARIAELEAALTAMTDERDDALNLVERKNIECESWQSRLADVQAQADTYKREWEASQAQIDRQIEDARLDEADFKAQIAQAEKARDSARFIADKKHGLIEQMRAEREADAPVLAAAAMLAEFHRVFVPQGMDVRAVRAKLLREEHQELQDAIASNDRIAIAHELADLVYVAYGTALVFDVDLDIALAEVHRANMSKLGDDGKPVLREDGKVLKGPNYSKPDLSKAVRARRAQGEAG